MYAINLDVCNLSPHPCEMKFYFCIDAVKVLEKWLKCMKINEINVISTSEQLETS